MTGAGQGGAGKRHRPTAPLTPDPFRTQKSAETLPWTLLGATLVGALRKTARGGAPNFFTPAVSVQPKPQTLSRNFTRIPPLGNSSVFPRFQKGSTPSGDAMDSGLAH